MYIRAVRYLAGRVSEQRERDRIVRGRRLICLRENVNLGCVAHPSDPLCALARVYTRGMNFDYLLLFCPRELR